MTHRIEVHKLTPLRWYERPMHAQVLGLGVGALIGIALIYAGCL